MNITLNATVSIEKFMYFSSRTYFSTIYGAWRSKSIEDALDNLLAHVKRKDEYNTSIKSTTEQV